MQTQHLHFFKENSPKISTHSSYSLTTILEWWCLYMTIEWSWKVFLPLKKRQTLRFIETISGLTLFLAHHPVYMDFKVWLVTVKWDDQDPQTLFLALVPHVWIQSNVFTDSGFPRAKPLRASCYPKIRLSLVLWQKWGYLSGHPDLLDGVHVRESVRDVAVLS